MNPVVLAGLLLLAVGLGFWLWRSLGISFFRFLGLLHDVTVKITINDPHGLHMRRCKDLVQVARKHLAYQIYIRNPDKPSLSWANARSILSLQALAVRGFAKGEAPPVVEVHVHGYRPGKPLRDIRKVLENDPRKYLNIYELSNLAKEVGGQLVVRPVPVSTATLGRRIARRLRLLGHRAPRESDKP